MYVIHPISLSLTSPSLVSLTPVSLFPSISFSLSLPLSLSLSVSPLPLLPPSSELFYRLYNYLYLYAYNIIRYISLIHLYTGVYLRILSIILHPYLMIESFSHDIIMRFMFSGNGVCKADSNCALIPNVLCIGMTISAVSNF